MVDSVLRRKWSAWSRISAAVRLRPNFIAPVAQNVQVSGQPDWLLRHSDAAPVAVAHQDGLDRPAVVRAEERLLGAVLGLGLAVEVEGGQRDVSLEPARRPAGRLVISSYERAPRATHSQI